MSTPDLAPRRPVFGIVVVWVATLLGGVAVGIFAPIGDRATWFGIVLGGALVLSFAVQLSYGRPQRFIRRVSISILGALLVLGFVSAAAGVVSVLSSL